MSNSPQPPLILRGGVGIPQDFELRRALKYSLYVHLGAVVLLMLGPYIGLGGTPFERTQVTWVVLPKGAEGEIGAGFKKAADLPKATIEDSKLPPPPEPPKKEEKSVAPPEPPEPPKKAMPEPAKDKKSKPSQKVKPPDDISKALAKIRKQVARREPDAAQIKDQPGGVPYGSPTGVKVSPNDPEYIRYQAKIRSQIVDHWIPPIGAADSAAALFCRLIVTVDATGRVLTMEWDHRSGDELFDLSAVRAVRGASPLEPPPERIQGEALQEGFLIDFVPSQIQ